MKSSAADKSYYNCEISRPLSYFGFHNMDFIAEQNKNEKVFESHKAQSLTGHQKRTAQILRASHVYSIDNFVAS